MTNEQNAYQGEIEVFLCSSCASAMTWDEGVQKFRCSSCNTEVADPEGDGIVSELPFNQYYVEKAKEDWGSGRVFITCRSCGAQVSVAEDETSVNCSYCGSPHVLSTRQEAGLPPEGVVPFVIDEAKAKEIFNKWVGKRFWAPKELKKLYQQLKLKGVYEPFWTFDSSTVSSWHASGGEAYYVTVERNNQKYRERRIRWHPIRGTWQQNFDDVLVCANNAHSSLMDKLAYYDTSETRPYSSEYLAGVGAQHYTLMPDQGFVVAKQMMEQSIRKEITQSILRHYDEVSSLRTNTNFSNVFFKHLLLPVWTTGFMYKDKQYGCMINGQTGKIVGEYPKSALKIILAVLLGIGIFAVMIMIFYYL